MAKRTDSTESGIHDQPWLWVHRVGVTPFFISALVLVYALALSVPGEAVPLTWALLLTGGIAASLWAIAKRKWGGSKKVKDRQLYKYVEALIVTSVASTMTMKIWAELTWDWVLWLGGAWVVLTLLFGSFWWNDNSNLIRIEVQADVLRWPEVAKRIGMPTLQKGQVRKTETGGRVRFWWNEGSLTASRVRSQQDVLEQLVGAPSGAAKFINVTDDADNVDGTQVEMVWNDRAPGRTSAIDFTEPTASRVTDRILLGIAEDGTEVWMQIYDPEFGIQHMIAGGVTGSGKSGFYHLLLAETADCRDMVRWGMDFKGGMSFRPWGPMFDWLITDEEDAMPMFSALRTVLEARAKYAARRGWDPWQPDADHPLLCLFVDECAIPFSMGHYEVVELGKIIAQQGRAAGVMMCLATQHATNESVGSQQIMKNLNRRFAFRCSDSSQQSVLLPNAYGKVDCTEIPAGKIHAGKCYWSDGGVVSQLLMRIRYVSKDMIKDLVEKYWTFRCDLDRGSARAARKATVGKDGNNAYDQRHIWTIDDVQIPDDQLWTGDEHGNWDAAWDEILGDNPTAPPAPVEKVPRVPAPTAADSTPTEPEEEIVTYDESKGQVRYDEAFLQPDTQEGRDQLAADIAAFQAERQDRYSPEEARERLHEALRAAGARGVEFGKLCEFVGRKKSWTSNELLTLLRETQSVHRPEHGVWAYTDLELSKLSTASQGPSSGN